MSAAAKLSKLRVKMPHPGDSGATPEPPVISTRDARALVPALQFALLQASGNEQLQDTDNALQQLLNEANKPRRWGSKPDIMRKSYKENMESPADSVSAGSSDNHVPWSSLRGKSKESSETPRKPSVDLESVKSRHKASLEQMKKVIGDAELLRSEHSELRKRTMELSEVHARLDTQNGGALQDKIGNLIRENERLKEQVKRLSDTGGGSWSIWKLLGLGGRAGQCRIRALDCFTRPEDVESR
jgi:hypothetical protein